MNKCLVLRGYYNVAVKHLNSNWGGMYRGLSDEIEEYEEAVDNSSSKDSALRGFVCVESLLRRVNQCEWSHYKIKKPVQLTSRSWEGLGELKRVIGDLCRSSKAATAEFELGGGVINRHDTKSWKEMIQHKTLTHLHNDIIKIIDNLRPSLKDHNNPSFLSIGEGTAICLVHIRAPEQLNKLFYKLLNVSH